jgi:hypothetical protein
MKKIILFVILFICNNLLSQNIISNKKIGLLFKMDDPMILLRNGGNGQIYKTIKFEDINSNNEFYEVVKFMQTINPRDKILKTYTENKFNEIIVINDKIDLDSLPDSKINERKVYKKDLSFFKTKYNVDYLLFVNGIYGLEVEYVFGISADKRSNIFLYNSFVDLSTNKIIDEFKVSDIKNIRKKNLISPPDYPNVVLSINLLLEKNIVPKIIEKTQKMLEIGE